jgi:hypothetical protein
MFSEPSSFLPKFLIFFKSHPLAFINGFYPPIQFTLEIGGPNINFLDLAIAIKNHKHDFEIFRKPTHTDLVIDGSSYHHPSHRHAAILSMIHRLVCLPLPPRAIAKETNIIKHIAEINNVDVDVDRIIRRKRIALALNQTTTHKRDAPKPKWIRIPFLGRLSGKISRVLRKFDLRPAYYSVNRIRDIFPSSKDPIPTQEKSGVYRLECADYLTVYIGQTGRKLRDRTAEHESAVARILRRIFSIAIIPSPGELVLISCTWTFEARDLRPSKKLISGNIRSTPALILRIK